MHVVLVSYCEKRALKRTRAVLDSYALRSGAHTWMTPITMEGLGELRAMLRRTATRQTSVACFRNDGRARMRLLWIVGNKRHFDRHGISPVATQASKRKNPFPVWARIAALLASAAGYTHDIGKFGITFQNKLRNPQPTADPVRHEWLSLLVLRQMLKGVSWDEAWHSINTRAYKDVTPFSGSLGSPVDALLYLVATHHKLPRADDGNKIGNSVYVRDPTHKPQPCVTPTQQMLDRIRHRVDKVQTLEADDNPVYWRGLATFSRMALILADHAVSAEKIFTKNSPAYANTDRATKALNQDLEWHLSQVGNTAGDMVYNMLSLVPPALSTEAVERICMRATGLYAWQERIARALGESNRNAQIPHLVLNLAGTGTGKTRANVRAICALNEQGEVRLATALNLRTLTLQTGDAYRGQLQIGADEMACVIGDKLTILLHDYQKSLSRNTKEMLMDDDENTPEDEIDTVSAFDYNDAPAWLQHFLRKEPRLAAVIGAPVLVSTIDFLVAAGEPQRQGNHALAALRLMTSDLVLDEIDGYDPKPLLAVLRLVMMAAFFGRHVVASSATLSRPVARLLWQAYAKGAEMRGLLTGEQSFRTALIDDQIAPKVWMPESSDEFIADYEQHVLAMMSGLSGARYRVPYLQRVEKRDLQSWGAALLAAVKILHSAQAWMDPKTGKRISIGLIRMANVRPAVKAAKYLAGKLKQARVACYHSQHFAIQRFYIEQRLDCLLNRKQGNHHILADEEIRRMLDDPECEELLLIVVATPVEEIGRDHDFDWAVIEPSSAQSIVQTAGRVNRHRLEPVEKPNIAILQFNRKGVETQSGPAFTHPGLEAAGTHDSHDLAELFAWQSLSSVDARMRFDHRHLFAKCDDAAIEKQTEKLFASMLATDPLMNQWMAQETYTKAPLRERDQLIRAEYRLVELADNTCYQALLEGSKDGPQSRKILHIDPAASNAWLSLMDEELAELAAEAGVPSEDALSVSLPLRKDELENVYYDEMARHLSFGFYRKKSGRLKSRAN